MFHLFNRVYLEHDYAIDCSLQRIIWSNVAGYETVDDFKGFNWVTPIHTEHAVDELTSEYIIATLDRVRYLNSKVVIYCDSETYVKVVSLWLKVIFPDRYQRLLPLALGSIDLREQGTIGLSKTRVYLSATKGIAEKAESIVVPDAAKGLLDAVRDGLSIEHNALLAYLGDGRASAYYRKQAAMFVERTFKEYVAEVSTFNALTTFSRMSREDIIRFSENGFNITKGDYPIITKMDEAFDFDNDLVGQMLRLQQQAYGDQEPTKDLARLTQIVFRGEGDWVDGVKHFERIIVSTDFGLSAISQTDIENVNFPYMQAIIIHRDYFTS